jgi:hypothetical protein
VSDRGLEEVAALKTLQDLNLAANSKITDAGLAHVSTLANLKSLNVHGCTEITNASLAHISVLSGVGGLTSLDIGGCRKITEAGFEHIAALIGLRELNLSFCPDRKLSGSGLEHIACLPFLEDINLSFSGGCNVAMFNRVLAMQTLQRVSLMWHQFVTNDTLNQFVINDMFERWATLPNLTYLHFGGVKYVSSANLANFKNHPTLTSLNLPYCGSIDDEAVRCASEIPGLQELDLACCDKVTDAGLVHLASLKHLRRLDLGAHLKTTQGCVDWLKQELPGLLVDSVPPLRSLAHGNQNIRPWGLCCKRAKDCSSPNGI